MANKLSGFQSNCIVSYFYRFPMKMRATPTVLASWPAYTQSNAAFNSFDQPTVDQARLLFQTNSIAPNAGVAWTAGGNNIMQGNARL